MFLLVAVMSLIDSVWGSLICFMSLNFHHLFFPLSLQNHVDQRCLLCPSVFIFAEKLSSISLSLALIFKSISFKNIWTDSASLQTFKYFPHMEGCSISRKISVCVSDHLLGPSLHSLLYAHLFTGHIFCLPCF